MNKGIRCFGIATVFNNIGQFLNAYPGLNLISIGSGNGLLENQIRILFGINIICIDPNPESYSPPPIVIIPDFPSVEALIDGSPQLVGNCLILLNWCNPNESRYDFDAIQSLRPIAFISIFESFMGGQALQVVNSFMTIFVVMMNIHLFIQQMVLTRDC
jgi:hypothetical protein